MPASLASDRDRDTLKSFARRIDPSDAGAHNNLGVLYYNKGLYDEAAAAFTRALELDAKMHVAQRNLEVAHSNTGHYERRIAALRERLRFRADDREARWELGRAYATLGRPDEAVAEFTALLRHHPDDLGTVVQLGLAEQATGNLGEAQHWFELANRLDPSSSVTRFHLGEVLYNQGRLEGALDALTRAIELNPENPDAHFLLSFVYGDMGRHEDAAAEGKRAVGLNPALSRAQANLSLERYTPATADDPAAASGDRRSRRSMQVAEGVELAHYNLGLAFRQQGYFAEAQREYEIAFERGEAPALVLQAMAEVDLLRKDFTAAIARYDALLRESPESPKLWNERGVAVHQQGRVAEAAEDYGKALEADPAYAIAHNNLGVALLHGGQHERAAAAFQAALAVNSGFEKARLNLGLLYTRHGQFASALDAFRQLLATAPESALAWNGVGLVLGELRKFEEARNAFARAIQSSPDFAEAHYNLSFALSALGEHDGALRENKRALELDPFYVPQKFALAMDLEYEDPDLSVAPDLGGEQRVSGAVERFTFDPALLDSLFTELAPPDDAVPEAAAAADAYGMAADYLATGLYDRANAEASRAMARGADPADGNVLLGEILCRQGAFGDALERYRAARASSPGHAGAQRGEAHTLLLLGRGREARAAAEELLASTPSDADALMLAAACRFEAGDPAAALDALAAARRVAPLRAEVLRSKGNISRALGDTDGAIRAYREALALDADFAAVRFDLACLLSRQERWAEAETELLAALEAVPTYAEATLELAALRRRTGRLHDAVGLLADLLQRDSYNFDAHIALGEALIALSATADAARAFRRVLAFDPEHAGATFFEGVLLSGQKRYRAAIERWQRVVELEPAGEYARRARRERRSAEDLLVVFGNRLGGG